MKTVVGYNGSGADIRQPTGPNEKDRFGSTLCYPSGGVTSSVVPFEFEFGDSKVRVGFALPLDFDGPIEIAKYRGFSVSTIWRNGVSVSSDQ